MTKEDVLESIKAFFLSIVSPGEWKNMTVTIGIQPGVIRISGYVTKMDDSIEALIPKYPNGEHELFFQFHDLTTEEGRNKWNKADLIFYPNHQCKIDYFWDSVYQDRIDAKNRDAEKTIPGYVSPKWKWEL